MQTTAAAGGEVFEIPACCSKQAERSPRVRRESSKHPFSRDTYLIQPVLVQVKFFVRRETSSLVEARCGHRDPKSTEASSSPTGLEPIKVFLARKRQATIYCLCLSTMKTSIPSCSRALINMQGSCYGPAIFAKMARPEQQVISQFY